MIKTNISEEVKKRLTLINLLCLQVSVSTEHDAYYKYHGHSNTLNVSVDEGGYTNAEHSQWVVHCEEVSDLIVDVLDECIEKLEGYLK